MKKWIGYQKGINLGGWLSQCDYSEDRLENFIVKKDIETIASWGMDHVRVPFDYNIIEDEAGNRNEDGFKYIDRVIEWCGEYGLNMVLDLHKTFGFSFDSGEKQEGFFEKEDYQERFYKLWEDCAARYGKYSDRVAFELLNEVTDKEYLDAWLRISDTCISRIRAICPDVYILIGNYWNNSLWSVKDLAMPQDDHIVYNFHCYEPILFTHQGAGWVENMPLDYRVKFGETIEWMNSEIIRLGAGLYVFDDIDGLDKPLGPDYFSTIFESAVKTAQDRGVMLYCGEYGVIEKSTPEDTLLWFAAIHATFEKHGIGRAAWSYKQMDFGISDARLDSVREELLKLL